MHHQLSRAPFIIITFLITQGAPSKGLLMGICGLVLSRTFMIAVAFQIVPAFSILVFHHGKTGLLPSFSSIFYLGTLMQGYNYANIKQIVKKDFKDPCN